MRALRIDPDNSVTELVLPHSDAFCVIRVQVGSPDFVDHGAYHRRAVLHLHGSGRTLGLPQNLTAWVSASAWRGVALYPLAGTIVVTGRTADGDVTALDDDLAEHAQAVAHTVRETLTQCQRRPPISDEAALGELLVYAARDVTA